MALTGIRIEGERYPPNLATRVVPWAGSRSCGLTYFGQARAASQHAGRLVFREDDPGLPGSEARIRPAWRDGRH